MLDRDLAGLIGYETRVLNQIMKRKLYRFNIEDYFQLSSFEFNNWKSQIVTSKEDKIGLRKLPYAFTENGIKVLSTIKKNSKKIIGKILENF